MDEAMKRVGSLLTKKSILALSGLLGVTGGLILIVFMIIIFVIIGVGAGGVTNSNDGSFGYGNLSPHVMQYQSLVEKYAEQEGVIEHVPVILAIMQQETEGSPDAFDPMQSSESLCGYIGCITDPEHSIQQGVKQFKNVITLAKGDLKLAIQSYNFGTGFINYVKNRNGVYEFNKTIGNKQTYDLAISYSQEQYQRQLDLGNGGLFTCLRAESKPLNACYGDILYVWSVMQYVIPVGIGEWTYPVLGHNQITSPYGNRNDPFTGNITKHNGVDFSCRQKNLPIQAVDDGVIVVSEFGISGLGFGGYGNVVVIKHDNNLYSLYAHLNNRNVSVGEQIKQGERLGTCGTTGNSTGIHLHLEARTSIFGGQFDPMTLLK